MVKRNTRKQYGGAYGFGASITGGLVNNYGQDIIPLGGKLTPDCVAVGKTDLMGFGGAKGLPGLSGGRRRQTGGRYGFVSADPLLVGGTPSMSGVPSFTRIAAETGTQNAYNPGPHALVTQPPVGQRGGAQPLLGGDNLAYIAPTAGYAQSASGWVGSTGSPVLLNIPYEARAMNQACLKTGGARKAKKSRKVKKTKKTRKVRKN